MSRLRLDMGTVPAGEYTLHFGLFEDETPIRFGMKEDYYCEGYYALGKITVE